MAAAHLALLLLIFAAQSTAQLLKTVNGSIVMQIPGAALTLSSTSSTAESSLLVGIDAALTAEQTRAMQAEASLALQLGAERTRATLAEAAELSRAMGAEAVLAASIADERVRALTAEANISSTLAAEVARALQAEAAETRRAMAAEGNITAQVTADRTRAMTVEFGLAGNLSAETIRALQAEGTLTTQVSGETLRATLAESSLGQALQQTQASLAVAVNAQRDLSSALADSRSAQRAAQDSTNATLTSVLAQLSSLSTCASRGQLVAPNGTCINAAGTSVTSVTAESTVCQGRINSSSTAQCAAGYSPLSYVASACNGASFTCTGVLCPPNSFGINVPSGCLCNAGYNGTIIPSTNAPLFYQGTCAPAPCPPFGNGASVPAGCVCNAGYTGAIFSSSISPFYTSTCTGVPCPGGSSGSNVISGCTCPTGYSSTITPTSTSPFVSGNCMPMSCAALKAQVPSIVSGPQQLRIPAVNGGAPFWVYCDFAIDGGIGYAVVFNRYFANFQAGPSPTEMSVNTATGDGTLTSALMAAPGTIFANYGGSGGTRMIVYATIGQNNGGGITSGTTYRAVRFTMSPANMARCWNGDATTGFVSGASWVAFPGAQTGTSGMVLGVHGTSGGVYQWSEGSTGNTNTLFEYCPVQGADPNHYWMVYSGSDVAGSSYYRISPLYGNNGGTVGPLYNRWGGIALF